MGTDKQPQPTDNVATKQHVCGSNEAVFRDGKPVLVGGGVTDDDLACMMDTWADAVGTDRTVAITQHKYEG